MSETLWVAVIAALAPIGAVLWGKRGTTRQLLEIHAIVNSRLEAAVDKVDRALKTIADLQAEVRRLKELLEKRRD